MRNKKGSVILVVLIAIVFFIFGMLIFNLIKPDVTRVRSAAELNCTGIPDTAGDRATCLVVDGIIPYFIILIVAVAGGYIMDRALR
jgi:hypothetical protein